jgi:hypothetical protein
VNAQVVDAAPKGDAHFDRLAEGWERYKSVGRPGWSIE